MEYKKGETKLGLIKKYLAQREYANVPSRTLARMLVEQHPEIFKNIEAARTDVRMMRGKSGENHRNKYQKDAGKYYDQYIEYNIPTSFSEPYKPFVIPLNYNHGLILNDTHCPFHDERAIRIAINDGKDNGVDFVYLNGDTSDQYWTSPFVKYGIRHPFTYQQEIDKCREMLDLLMDEFPKAKIFYKMANHEQRLEMYMSKRTEFIGMKDFSLEHLLELVDRNIDVIQSGQFAEFDKLNILHGHEFGHSGNYAPVNMARSLYLKAKDNSMCGHGHRTSEHTEVIPMSGKLITCWSVGCLCHLHPAYAPLNTWNHGFARIKREKWGFSVDNKRIRDYQIM